MKVAGGGRRGERGGLRFDELHESVGALERFQKRRSEMAGDRQIFIWIVSPSKKRSNWQLLKVENSDAELLFI